VTGLIYLPVIAVQESAEKNDLANALVTLLTPVRSGT
jgi:hypothetical protein